MTDNKGKTKATILHELESIKGLLLEDDEIPILQEAISDEPAFERPLPKRDLDELHDVFQALSQNIRTASDKIGAPSTTPSFRSPGATGAFTQEFEKSRLAKADTDEKQGSLFSETRPDRETSAVQLNDYHDEISLDLADDEASTDSATDAAGEAKKQAHEQNSQPLNYAVSKSITPPPRPAALAKASGENPFLPQHIRARLHGNNPPPLFSSNRDKGPAPTVNKPVGEALSRQQLIREVVAAVLPEVEQELRQRLQTLTDEQLEELLNDD